MVKDKIIMVIRSSTFFHSIDTTPTALNLLSVSSSFCFSFFSISFAVDGTNCCHPPSHCTILLDVVRMNMHHIQRDDAVHNVDENDTHWTIVARTIQAALVSASTISELPAVPSDLPMDFRSGRLWDLHSVQPSDPQWDPRSGSPWGLDTEHIVQQNLTQKRFEME